MHVVMSELDIRQTDFVNIAQELLAGGRILRFQARGFSMRPSILDQDFLEIHSISQNEVSMGDILLYLSIDGRILVHRVVKKLRTERGAAWILQGDALLYPDGVVETRQIIGRVGQIERNGKRWLLHTPWQRVKGKAWVNILSMVKVVIRTGISIKCWLKLIIPPRNSP